MIKFDRVTLGKQAKELGFVRDTFEKVCRLSDVLKFFENDDLLKDTLALKGGTAINLTIFDLKLARDKVTEYLKGLLVRTSQEKEFMIAFSKGDFKPELLFSEEMAKKLISQPMASWKCKKIQERRKEIEL